MVFGLDSPLTWFAPPKHAGGQHGERKSLTFAFQGLGQHVLDVGPTYHRIDIFPYILHRLGDDDNQRKPTLKSLISCIAPAVDLSSACLPRSAFSRQAGKQASKPASQSQIPRIAAQLNTITNTLSNPMALIRTRAPQHSSRTAGHE